MLHSFCMINDSGVMRKKRSGLVPIANENELYKEIFLCECQQKKEILHMHDICKYLHQLTTNIISSNKTIC